MVINNFDIFRTGLGPAKANPELFVDSNAVLTLAVTVQRLQHVARRHLKIIQLICSMELADFPQGNALKTDKASHATPACKLLCVLTLERYDHGSMITPHDNNAKRYCSE
jgi:hypothetical protein